jgi:hypothetical protein
VPFVVSEAKGRFYRRKDAKYLIYLPTKLCGDSMFPFNPGSCIKIKPGFDVYVKISFKKGDDKLLIEKWKEPYVLKL